MALGTYNTMIVPVLEQPQKMSRRVDNSWHERWGMGSRPKSLPDVGGGDRMGQKDIVGEVSKGK